MIPVVQPSFTGGELAPGLHGRVDLAVYSTSLERCKNFIAQAYGGIKNRPGTRFAGAAYAAQTVARLVPFIYNAEQSYVLELGAVAGGDQYIRVFSRGRPVVYQDNVPSGYSAGDQVEILNLPWLPGDIAALKFSQSADVLTVTHPSYAPMQIKRYAHDQWGVTPFEFENGPFGPVNTDKSLFVTASAPTGVVTLTASANIFEPKHRGLFFKLEQKDFGVPWEPNVATNLDDIRRSDGKYYRAVNSGTTGTVRPTHLADRWKDGSKTDAVEWEFLHPGFGVVQLGDIAAASNTCEATVISRIPDAISNGVLGGSVIVNVSDIGPSGDEVILTVDSTASLPTATFTCTVNLNYYNTSDGLVTYNATAEATVLSPTEILLHVLWTGFFNFAEFSSGTVHYRTTNSSTDTYKWAFGAWGEAPGYPSCSTYFQQRHVFGGSPDFPQTVWMSRTNAYTDFSESTPILDDDALQFTLASSQIDRVRSLLSLDKLTIFTQGGNWVTGSGQDDVITPGNISAKLQNYYGSSNLTPLAIGNTALYYGKGGTIRDMSYEFASDTYTGNDLTVRAAHLFENKQIVDWSFQQSPFPIVWAVRDDGYLLGMSYLREQSVSGWHQHEFSGTVESVCVLNECNQDHVYLLMKRTINGSTYRSVEYMSNRIDDLYEQFFVDAGITYDGRNVSGGNITVTGGTLWTAAAAEDLTITYTPGGTISTLFTGGSDVGDHIVLEAADGTRHRINITAYTSGTVVTGRIVSGTLPADLRAAATSSWALARDNFSGLAHLEGKTVAVYSDGAYLGTRTVSSGAVSLTGVPGYVVHIGLPITAIAKTLRVTLPGQSGPALEQKKLVTQVHFLLENSRSFFVGPDETNVYRCSIGSSTYEASGGVQSGTAVVSTQAGWNRDGQVVVKHTDPTALSILAITPDMLITAGAKP
jgi:hypothetical protein